MRYFTAIAVLLFGFSAQAAPVTWTLEGVAFDDGGTASGSFIYDATFDVYSSINITTTAGTDLAGDTYYYAKGVFTNQLSLVATSLDIPDLTNAPAFALFFSAGLTNSGGIVSLTQGPSRESLCADVECNIGQGEPFSRDVIAGTITGVPIPAAVWLFGSALAGLGWLRRKQTVC